jgi:divalent metal cation (Fe/Co/Zn/Cd) transporter
MVHGNNMSRPDDRAQWIRQIATLALLTAGFHLLQFVASTALWIRAGSPVIAAFGLDAIVSAVAAPLLSVRIRRSYDKLATEWKSRVVAYGYIVGAVLSLLLGVSSFLADHHAQRSLLGILLAAVSMLVVPIAGSYMKVLAVELRNQTLKDAAVFTFGNSYLSMVLLISLLLNAGMDFAWGDALGALVMVPFLAQKGIQILIEEGSSEYVED